MAFLDINPRYRDFLRRQGLVHVEDFLSLPAVIISGHPTRNVGQVTLGQEPETLAAFLKREHRILWKDRVTSVWHGFGWVSKSRREANLLQALRQAGVACPEWLAAGEDDRGRAFLLVRAVSGALDLRLFLQQQRTLPPGQRYQFARRLGAELARLHGLGFDHPDLYSKHVLVNPVDQSLHFLDWQRSRRHSRLTWRQRRRDLAALQATLAPHLAGARERLACLRAYLQQVDPREHGAVLRRELRWLRRQAQTLFRRRRIRELHQPPLAVGTQNLIWLDGEALCVTREFLTLVQGRLPDWLGRPLPAEGAAEQVSRTRVALPGGREGLLVRRRTLFPRGWLRHGLWRRPLTSTELRQAGLLFRLQRHGVPTPRLLAVGQRLVSPWCLESFLLTEPLPGTVPLVRWLAGWDSPASTLSTPNRCRSLLREGVRLLRRLHEAGCSLASDRVGCPLRVQCLPGTTPALVLESVEGLSTHRAPSRARFRRDLALLQRTWSTATLANDQGPHPGD